MYRLPVQSERTRQRDEIPASVEFPFCDCVGDHTMHAYAHPYAYAYAYTARAYAHGHAHTCPRSNHIRFGLHY